MGNKNATHLLHEQSAPFVEKFPGSVQTIRTIYYRDTSSQGKEIMFIPGQDFDQLFKDNVKKRFVPMTVTKYEPVINNKISSFDENLWLDKMAREFKATIEVDPMVRAENSTPLKVTIEVDPTVRVSERAENPIPLKRSLLLGLPEDETFEFSDLCELLKYDVGGYFKMHTDRKRTATHTHTMCIYPPKMLIHSLDIGESRSSKNDSGGELVLELSGGHKHTIAPGLTEWKACIFPINMMHSSLPAHDTKYVIKCSLDLYEIHHRSYGDRKIPANVPGLTRGPVMCD